MVTGIERIVCIGLTRVFRLLARNRMERTGIIIGKRSGWIECQGLVLVRNLSGRPDRFYMDPWGIVVAHQAAWNIGLEPVAIFHTHPCGAPVPSVYDLEGMRRWPMPWVIASPSSVKAWVLKGENTVELRLDD